jgi:hypothetical protein
VSGLVLLAIVLAAVALVVAVAAATVAHRLSRRPPLSPPAARFTPRVHARETRPQLAATVRQQRPRFAAARVVAGGSMAPARFTACSRVPREAAGLNGRLRGRVDVNPRAICTVCGAPIGICGGRH